jgi:hypothetical protein
MKDAKQKELWMAMMPAVFGYGIAVLSDSKAEAMKICRKEFNEYRVARGNKRTRSMKDFLEQFEYWGGHCAPIEMNKAYNDNFNR